MTKFSKGTMKDTTIKVTSKSLYSIAELFAGMTCMNMRNYLRPHLPLNNITKNI